MVETHGVYRLNAESAAQQSGGLYIDLAQDSLSYFETLGREETKRDFLWLQPDPTHVKFPGSVEDTTHFTELGACGLSLIVARHLAEMIPGSGFIDEEKHTSPTSNSGGRPAAVLTCANEISAKRRP